MKKNSKWFIATLVAIALIAGYTAAFASHPGGDVTLKYFNAGTATPVGTGGTIPYSPKATCGMTGTCHQGDGGHNYGSGVKNSTHVQGVLDSSNNVYWQAYQNKSYEHGVSVGRHMNQGRNEDYTNADRAAVGDPFFTSSLGMFGKY